MLSAQPSIECCEFGQGSHMKGPKHINFQLHHIINHKFVYVRVILTRNLPCLVGLHTNPMQFLGTRDFATIQAMQKRNMFQRNNTIGSAATLHWCHTNIVCAALNSHRIPVASHEFTRAVPHPAKSYANERRKFF
jgi:hypothetical protein